MHAQTDQQSVVRRRYHTHRFAAPLFLTPTAVVAHFAAVQGQDFLPAMWALGLRTAGATEASVEQAINDRQLVRTWPLRNTVHFVTAEDVRWLLELSAPRALKDNARRRELELDEAVFAQSRRVIERELQDGQPRSRPALRQALDDAGISTAGQRGIHIMGRLAQEGLICIGPRAGKQQTFVLLDAWLPPARPRTRDEALAELARRYFAGHGPATLKDYTWWSGLAAAEARAGLAMARPYLAQEAIGGETYWFDPAAPVGEIPSPAAHLLPFVDEYLVAYKDRSAVLPAVYNEMVDSGGVIFHQPILMDGLVVGIWTRTMKKEQVVIETKLFRPLSDAEQAALNSAGARLGVFLGLKAVLRAD
jgi:hypothetical protein